MAILESELAAARNGSADAKGSIHDDATASKLGFRGGTVAGSIHMDQFPPLLLRAFGHALLRDGALSLYFLNATTDREAVRAYVEEPSGGATQIRVWMKREDGLDVLRGHRLASATATKSALRTRDLRRAAIRASCGSCAELAAGHVARRVARAARAASGSASGSSRGCAAVRSIGTRVASPFGGPIAAPSALVELLWAAPTRTLARAHGQGGRLVRRDRGRAPRGAGLPRRDLHA